MSRPPPADMPPADMPPVYSEALTQEPSQPQQDDAASPASVRHTVFEQQVEDAEECIQKLRNMRNNAFRNYASMHSDITQRVQDLTTNIKDCARIQNIAELSLEVASPLYLIFKMIIPVMCRLFILPHRLYCERPH